MQTLVIGLSLPGAEFDNYTFLSAPSFGEYQRIIVDAGSVARSVADIVSGNAAHATYGGQAIVNGEPSAYAFSLRALLDMRRRETEWVLSHGGLVVITAIPEVDQPDIVGGPWRTYDFLPGFEILESDLLAGFGRPGAVLVEADHPFAAYIQQLAPHVAYRVYLNETGEAARNARVFARSAGGQAIGVEMPLGEGTLVILPPLVKPDQDRPRTAAVISECLAQWQTSRTRVREEML
jgi:hypothetical protein